MKPPTRSSEAGRAYLDLQNLARREGRGTQELLTLYVIERWLARLAASPHAQKLVLKGGMLLAAYDARRPTADVDALARSIPGDLRTMASLVSDVASVRLDDGVEYLTQSATSGVIRHDAAHPGVRVAMDGTIATAKVKLRLDINVGDPVIPPPAPVELPSIRPGLPPVQVLGYPAEAVLGEKIATAIELGPANTRVRDYADVYTLTGRNVIAHGAAREALLATAAYRGTRVERLSGTIKNLVELRGRIFDAYRNSLGNAGQHLPRSFEEVVSAVVAFADPLAQQRNEMTWQPTARQWLPTPASSRPQAILRSKDATRTANRRGRSASREGPADSRRPEPPGR
jgi:hypothetical protein